MQVVKLDVFAEPVNSFNKFGWESRFAVGVKHGTACPSSSMLVMVLRQSLGTATADCHVPLVWRKASDIAADCGRSESTVIRYRNQLKKDGYLFEIASGFGSRRTILVLKLPSWTRLEALESALFSLDSYCERTGNDRLSWVRDAVLYALATEEVSEKATDRADKKEQLCTMKRATLHNEKLPPYIHEENTIPSGSSRRIDRPQAKRPKPAPSAHSKKAARIVDLPALIALRSTLIALFAEVGRCLDEGAGTQLAKRYALRDATPEQLRTTLEIQLIRLVADGYKTGQIAAFLASDAPYWEPPAPPKHTQTPSTVATKAPQQPDPFAEFDRRLDELTAQFGDDLEQIHAALVDDFGTDHPLLRR